MVSSSLMCFSRGRLLLCRLSCDGPLCPYWRRAESDAGGGCQQRSVLFSLPNEPCCAFGNAVSFEGMTKAEVREHAQRFGLVTASKPDSQDICFVWTGPRTRDSRGPSRKSRRGATRGRNHRSCGGPARWLLRFTIGQRRGLGSRWENRFMCRPSMRTAVRGDTVRC